MFHATHDCCVLYSFSLQKRTITDGDVSERAAKLTRRKPREQWSGPVPMRDWRLRTFPAGGVQTATFINSDLRCNKFGIANYETQTVNMQPGDDSIALYFKDAPATFRKLYVKQHGEVKYTIIYGDPQCAIEHGKIVEM